MDVADFDFVLPHESIAQRPAPRGTARLMTLDRRTGAIAHRLVAELPSLLRAGDVLVLNDTKVIPARIFGTDEKGRRTEFLLVERVRREESGEEPEDEDSANRPELWRCLAKPGRRVKAGRKFLFEGGWEAEALASIAPAWPEPNSPSKKSALPSRTEGGLCVLRFTKPGSKRCSLLDDLPSLGSAPLPPYIHRPFGIADARDAVDYQTVFADRAGAIAAPTAGLHFTRELLGAVSARGIEITRVTLHVGLGTFRPVKVDRVEEHRMDFERAEIPADTAERVNAAKRDGRRVVAVGTTSVRTLEASARAHAGAVAAGAFETDLFLVPGATFDVVDALLTNFHLPRSTLLMLVAAFAQKDNVLRAYREAVAQGYRFFSYGDAMLIS
ncbi:MAG TPA: tRNA preQ1(34) S-adenosylmethionine ribosyltransferase-isomerase QueA [Thermoanaerobaculia bacterium]|nr:tRNA preQ1(34) S-adenosylmethionine ribosyltransferase-isomerase QueA [Thermoanaerobaculia bacterium]